MSWDYFFTGKQAWWRTNCLRSPKDRWKEDACHLSHPQARYMNSSGWLVKITMFDWWISPCWLPVLMPNPPIFQFLQSILKPSFPWKIIYVHCWISTWKFAGGYIALYPHCPLCTHKPWCCIIFGFQQFSFHRNNISVHSHSIVGYTPICSWAKKPGSCHGRKRFLARARALSFLTAGGLLWLRRGKFADGRHMVDDQFLRVIYIHVCIFVYRYTCFIDLCMYLYIYITSYPEFSLVQLGLKANMVGTLRGWTSSKKNLNLYNEDWTVFLENK